jgi:hypothetical protein
LGRDLNPLAAVQALKAKNGSPIKAFEDDGKISIANWLFYSFSKRLFNVL